MTNDHSSHQANRVVKLGATFSRRRFLSRPKSTKVKIPVIRWNFITYGDNNANFKMLSYFMYFFFFYSQAIDDTTSSDIIVVQVLNHENNFMNPNWLKIISVLKLVAYALKFQIMCNFL